MALLNLSVPVLFYMCCNPKGAGGWALLPLLEQVLLLGECTAELMGAGEACYLLHDGWILYGGDKSV